MSIQKLMSNIRYIKFNFNNRILYYTWNMVLLIWLLLSVSSLFAVDCSRCHNELVAPYLQKTSGFTEKAVGVMDKGQLQNATGNFGDLANFHLWFTNAGHWPRTARDDRQYVFGLGFMVAINDTNVIETATQTQPGGKIWDWLPSDDAAGRQYSGEVQAVSDETPFQASSDLRNTWPFGFYDGGDWVSTTERVWPGNFRVDVNSIDSLTLWEHPTSGNLPVAEGQFTSDRDIFCWYNDNQNPKGKVGIEVEQTAYSYGRPYAEDFVFWELEIINTNRNNDLDSVYIGFYARFRPDYDNHDYINIIDTDNDGKKDFIYVYDLNNTRNKTWAETNDPLGIVGLRIYDTPYKLGITDFHHFEKGATLNKDKEIWAVMTSAKNVDYLKNVSWYFHGSDPSIDYTGEDSLGAYYPYYNDVDSGVDGEGNAINFIVSCGPFTLKADSSVIISIGLIMGDGDYTQAAPDTTDLMKNVREANEMYRLYFQGSGPPDPPELFSAAGDGRGTLYWSSEPSESSVDVWTEKRDFEGYKIFRSTDLGLTWGREVTDVYGNFVGYEPIAQFDYTFYEDSTRYGRDISGIDPMFIDQDLGKNTGLVYTYVDSNLINGVEYWYCVTAYDHGDPDNSEPSYMYPLGASTFEPHTVAVIPRKRATDLAIPEGYMEPIGGKSEGLVRVEIVNPEDITGHIYEITFTDSALYLSEQGDSIETSYGTGFTLLDTTEGDTLIYNHPIPSEGDSLIIVDGLLLTLRDSEPGVSSIGWTKVMEDTSTFEWYAKMKDPNNFQEISEIILGIEDFKIVVVDSNNATENIPLMDGVFTDSIYDYIPILIKVYKITDPENVVDVSQYTQILDLRAVFPTSELLGPLGWDLVPGGAGYNPTGAGVVWPDIVVLRDSDIGVPIDIQSGIITDSTANQIWLKTQNGPESAIPPSPGDEFTIITGKPFRKSLSYIFNTGSVIVTDNDLPVNPLQELRVVPDPYVVTNTWETNEFGKKLQFNHLPRQCTIKIYTLVGEHISTVEHDSPTGSEFWNMRTKNDQFIAPGVYLYHAETPDGYEKSGRFLVIR